MLKSHHWKEWIAVLLLFCTGALVGAGVMRLYMDKSRFDPPRGPRDLQRQVLGKLDRELNLTPQQREAIRKIVKETLRRSVDIRKPIDKKMDKLIQRQYNKIRELLTPRQQKRFKAMHERFERRRKEFHRQSLIPPPPPPPPPAD